MSLMGTLARIGLAIIAAKGAGKILEHARGGSGGRPESGGDGGLFGEAARRPQQGGQGGSLEDLLGSILGGKGGKGGKGGGLGDILADLGGRRGGGQQGERRGGGLDDILGDLLGGMAGGRGGGSAPRTTGDSRPPGSDRISDIFNDAFRRGGEPAMRVTPEQDAAAGLMLSAMIQAAKSDGKIDADEQKRLFDKMGDASREEIRFLQQELQAPVDVQGLARRVPDGMEQPVYTMSVLAIDLDNRNEAQYLHDLATALNLDRATVNDVHATLGVRALYR